MASGRAITSDRALKSFYCDRHTPIPFSTARIFAKVPLFFPQFFSNLFQCSHCSPKQTHITLKNTKKISGLQPKSRILCNPIIKVKSLIWLRLPSFWFSCAELHKLVEAIKMKQKSLKFLIFYEIKAKLHGIVKL